MKDCSHETSPMMDVAFADAQGSRHMRVAVCIALYVTLAMIWMPGFTFGTVDFAVKPPAPEPKRVVLRPPPDKPIEQTVVQERKAKKMAMPDTTPNEPEVVVEPDPIEMPEVVSTDDWTIGIPDAPPASEPALIYEGMEGVEKPVITKRVKPNFPEKGIKIRMQGYVLLQAVMRKDGSIGEVKVLRGLGKGKFGFEQEAIKSLRRWEFLPGKYNGKPADVILNLRIDFRLS